MSLPTLALATARTRTEQLLANLRRLSYVAEGLAADRVQIIESCFADDCRMLLRVSYDDFRRLFEGRTVRFCVFHDRMEFHARLVDVEIIASSPSAFPVREDYVKLDAGEVTL